MQIIHVTLTSDPLPDGWTHYFYADQEVTFGSLYAAAFRLALGVPPTPERAGGSGYDAGLHPRPLRPGCWNGFIPIALTGRPFVLVDDEIRKIRGADLGLWFLTPDLRP